MATNISGIKKIAKVKNYLVEFIDFKKNSCFPAGHYYSPIVSVEDIKTKQDKIWENSKNDGIKGIELNSKNQINLVLELSSYYPEIPFKPEVQPNLRYQFDNPFYSYTDGIVLYSMIRHFKPKRIIEVGSGHSSAVMLDVNQLFFSNSIELTFVEPFTERLFSLMNEKDRKNSKVIETTIQSVDLDKFELLEKGDILFIDSTHVVKCGSDVNYILFEILPVLKSGVIIHFHDVFYPFEYPKSWVLGGRNWNEDYFLKAFLMYNPNFEILLFSDYLHRHHKEVFKNMPLAYKDFGGNFWMKKL